VRERGARERQRDERGRGDAPLRCGTPAEGLKCPNTGATSRDAYSATETVTNTSANPVLKTSERGLNAAPSGKSAPTSSVQPQT
jgi:hypothetical protein